MHTQVLVVGGGLAGLSLAKRLHTEGVDFHLVEARPRLGGRIHSPRLAWRGPVDAVSSDEDSQSDAAAFDLGPAWFWAGQPRMAALTQTLGVDIFRQWAVGALVFEDEHGRLQRADFAPMAGSFRVAGGLQRLVDALADALPRERVHLETPLLRVERLAEDPARLVATAGGMRLFAQRLVLALPPRVAAKTVFSPALSEDQLGAMNDVPTWMAGHAKVLALFDTPFWRSEGLSGDAMSRLGPLVEIHDASPMKGGAAALFGFVGWPPNRRTDEKALRDSVRSQLVRLFGEKAAAATLYVKDWAKDDATATPLDHQMLREHPDYGMPAALRDVWDGALLFSSSEVSPEFGGYLEGALAAAEDVAARILGDR